jgi:hypothetical protein
MALLAIGCAQPARAQADPPTVDDYRQLVTEAYAAAQRSDRIGLDERAEQLLAIDEILLPDGSNSPVDNGWLREALADEPPDFPVVVARLGAILDALGQPRSAPDADALAKLAQIYEVPPFKDRALPSAWDRFWEAIGQAIARFFERLFGNLPTPNPTPTTGTSFSGLSPAGWATLLLGLLLVVALIVYAVRSVRHSMVADARARTEAAEEEPLTAAQAVDQAQSEARAGNYRSAARHLYLSSLLWLEERGMLRYDRSRTNREYLQQLRGKPTHDALAPVVDTFEQVWYGHRPLDASAFDEYERQVQALRAQEERPA